jgi:hypothetical protein
MKLKSSNFISLFLSSSTLICCAMPALFVALGAGALFASLVSFLPFLATLSQYKVAITSFAAIMLLIAGFANHRSQYAPCPTDPELAKLCMQTRKRSKFIYFLSVAIFTFSAIFTYVVPRFL